MTPHPNTHRTETPPRPKLASHILGLRSALWTVWLFVRVITVLLLMLMGLSAGVYVVGLAAYASVVALSPRVGSTPVAGFAEFVALIMLAVVGGVTAVVVVSVRRGRGQW